MSIQSVKDLKIYNRSFELAMKVFEITRKFPDYEKFSMSSQILRSSRSVAANIREGYAKRTYQQVFIRHLVDALGSCEETRCWLDFAYNCRYMDAELHKELESHYSELSSMIFVLQKNWKKL